LPIWTEKALRHRIGDRRQHPARHGGYKQFPGMEGALYYYFGIPKNAINEAMVATPLQAVQGTT
jgi:hypothetical protein